MSVCNNAIRLDYGPTVILEHCIEGTEISFYTLYGHLSLATLEHLQAGQMLAKGELLGWFGNFPENGDWVPHLHFQIMTDMLGLHGNYPGACAPSQVQVWRDICLDPNLLLGIPPESFQKQGRDAAELLAVRQRHLGPSLSLSYHQPLKIVRGRGVYLYDDQGRAYLDCVNNISHVGHCHPQVVQALCRQAQTLNTNTRYLHDALATYVERLLAYFPKPLSVCFLVCSGSEANELALRLAKNYTGQKNIIALQAAYHGNTSALIDISHYKHAGPGGQGAGESVSIVPLPDVYRGPIKAEDRDAGKKYAAFVADAVDALLAAEQKPAAFIAESLPGCAGQIVLPENYLAEVYRTVRAAGGLCIADEVQVGFGRVGKHFWGFELQRVVPDIVTLGKPIGNGHPLAAVITTPEIAAAFANGMEYFNSFGGNPVSCAVGMAVLDVIEQEGLQANALQTGDCLLTGFRELQNQFTAIGDVRGEGLYLGVELVEDRDTLTPAAQLTDRLYNNLRAHGVLVGIDGPWHNVIKIKPPMLFDSGAADRLLSEMQKVLREVEQV